MKQVYTLIVLLMFGFNLQSQITEFPYYQGFEDDVFPPANWTSYPIIEGDMEFERVSVGEWPECLPHDGSAAMAQYNSFSASIGEEAVLISPELILTNDNSLRFWFYRSEDPSNNRHDKIEVYYNTQPNLEGAVFLDSISRAINFYPQVSFEDWYEYEFNFDNEGSTYIIFKAISAYGWKMFLDDIEIDNNSIDTEPPFIVSLDGTQVYANQEMNLKLRVRDDSDMPETLTGELIINGETTEVIMSNVTPLRGDYFYEGTISGQPNHTEGEIRFWLADNQENSIWSEYYTLHWDWVQPLLKEGFEGETFPPENWTITGQPLTWLTWDDYGVVYYTDSDNVEYEVSPPEGERQAAVEWDFQGNVQNEWMISPLVALTEDAALSFKTFVRYNSYDYDEYFVKITTDGFNWSTIWSAADYPAGVSDYSQNVNISLTDYVGEDIRIAWHAYNSLGTNLWYSWFVDDVKILSTDTIVGINESLSKKISSVYPNPFTNNFNLIFTMNNSGKGLLNIYGSNGSLVISKTFKSLNQGINKINIDGTNLKHGIYFYEFHGTDTFFTGKFVKQ